MKKVILSLTLLSLLVFPVLVAASTPPANTATPPGSPPARVDVVATLNHIVNWIFGILIIFAALMLVWAGFSFVTAGGDTAKVAGARDKVLYALIGVIVAFASRGLVALVQEFIR